MIKISITQDWLSRDTKICGGKFKFEKLKIDYLGQIVKGKSFGQLINDSVINICNFCLK